MTDRHKKYIIIAAILGAIVWGGGVALFLWLHELGLI
jgi:hypothetical protein